MHDGHRSRSQLIHLSSYMETQHFRLTAQVLAKKTFSHVPLPDDLGFFLGCQTSEETLKWGEKAQLIDYLNLLMWSKEG